MSAQWNAWANAQSGLTKSEKACLCHLASLVDCRGVVLVAAKDLADLMCCSQRTVERAYRGLKRRGLLKVEQRRRSDGHFGGSRVMLIWGNGSVPTLLPATSADAPLECSSPQAKASGDRAKTQTQRGDGAASTCGQAFVESSKGGLARLVRRVSDEGWKGNAAAELGQLLAEEGPTHLAKIFQAQRAFGEVDDMWQVLEVAWEHMRMDLAALVAARDPWALLAHMTKLHFAKIGQAKQTQRDVLGDMYSFDEVTESQISSQGAASQTAQLQQPGRPSGPESEVMIGVDDLWPEVWSFIDELVQLSLPETVAVAGTCRVLEIAVTAKSNRHYYAARDARLQTLGINPAGAREWMNAVTGRRGGEQPDLRDLLVRRELAIQVVQALRIPAWV